MPIFDQYYASNVQFSQILSSKNPNASRRRGIIGQNRSCGLDLAFSRRIDALGNCRRTTKARARNREHRAHGPPFMEAVSPAPPRAPYGLTDIPLSYSPHQPMLRATGNPSCGKR